METAASNRTRNGRAWHPLSAAGALLSLASAVGFLGLAVAAALGLLDNPYAGLIIFVALPSAFTAGLLLISLGMWSRRRQLQSDPTAGAAWPVLDLRRPRVRRAALGVLVLSGASAILVSLAGYGGVRYMESPEFCGQVCHTPMQPQFAAWQQGPHARVACVACHVGNDAGSFVHEKLAGVRRLAHAIANNYPRPIPSGADLPSATRTCGGCHDSRLALGEPVRTIRRFADDEHTTEVVTLLRMHIGGPQAATSTGRAIHWHADPSVRIEYAATDRTRQAIPYVRVTDADGRIREYLTPGAAADTSARGGLRTMDCTDCHNAAAHRVWPTADRAVDRAIAAGQIDRTLPFARRESLRLVQADYADERAALGAIRESLSTFYASRPSADNPAIVRTISAVQDVYRHNVFPTMNVTFGTYPDHNGHVTSEGCFRCHDGRHATADGAVISGSCSYCHTRLPSPS